VRGAEIAKNYIKIQEVTQRLMKIYPNEIKLMFRLGLFLKQVVNNEYEGQLIFEKIVYLYL
jgi:PAS domain S-box-containing protein